MKKALLLVIAAIFAACNAGTTSNQQEQPGEKSFKDLCPPAQNLPVYCLQQDSTIFHQALDVFADAAKAPLDELIITIGSHFLATPYVAHTLEIPAKEQLVVNLQGMDCTTFVEYVLAITMVIKDGQADFSHFTNMLSCLRYREGSPQGYPSRLHYFSEWLHANQHKGFITIISDELGSQPFDAEVYFMSRNPHLYRQLENKKYVEQIKKAEQRISTYENNYIPKEEIHLMEDKIKNGDIIAFTTNIGGLDVSHTGFAIHHEGRLHLLHASTRTHRVEITPVPLSDYLAPMGRVTGILAARLSL